MIHTYIVWYLSSFSHVLIKLIDKGIRIEPVISIYVYLYKHMCVYDPFVSDGLRSLFIYKETLSLSSKSIYLYTGYLTHTLVCICACVVCVCMYV